MSLAGAFKEALSVYRKDKWIGVFSTIPILIGAVIYTAFGNYLYGDLLDMGKKFIQEKISSGGWSEFFFWLLAGILTIAFYFLLSWTFVLVVSMLAAPFNDLISSRVEKVLIGEVPDDIGLSIKRMMARLAFTMVNELKKITFIIFLNILAFTLSFIAILAPVGMVISALLMSVGFLDYSWSRKDLKFGQCLSDLRNSFFSYGIAGGVFLLLITVPIVNLFALPFGVVYFTVLFIKKDQTILVSA